MKRAMHILRRRYQERYIILDGPPASEIADLRILCDLADYELVVARRYGHTTNPQTANCLNAIGDKKLPGIAFNEEPRSADSLT